jgi:aconitate hydratase
MGVIPLQFYKGDSAEDLALRGTETFSVAGIEALKAGELPRELTVVATADDGSTTEFRVIVRIDTPMEAEYFRHGGILRYVLRQLAG